MSSSSIREGHWERRPDGRPERVLRDSASGRKWRVWLEDTGGVPGARAEQCLVCDAGDVVRRVWQVPDDWARMPAGALLQRIEHGAAPPPGAPGVATGDQGGDSAVQDAPA